MYGAQLYVSGGIQFQFLGIIDEIDLPDFGCLAWFSPRNHDVVFSCGNSADFPCTGRNHASLATDRLSLDLIPESGWPQHGKSLGATVETVEKQMQCRNRCEMDIGLDAIAVAKRNRGSTIWIGSVPIVSRRVSDIERAILIHCRRCVCLVHGMKGIPRCGRDTEEICAGSKWSKLVGSQIVGGVHAVFPNSFDTLFLEPLEEGYVAPTHGFAGFVQNLAREYGGGRQAQRQVLGIQTGSGDNRGRELRVLFVGGCQETCLG